MLQRMVLAALIASTSWLTVPSLASNAAGVQTLPAQTITKATPTHPCTMTVKGVPVSTTCHGVVTIAVDAVITTPSNLVAAGLAGMAYATTWCYNWSMYWDEWSPSGWLYQVSQWSTDCYNGSSDWTVPGQHNVNCTSADWAGWHCDWSAPCPRTCNGNYWSGYYWANITWDNMQTIYTSPWGSVWEVDETYLRWYSQPNGHNWYWYGH